MRKISEVSLRLCVLACSIFAFVLSRTQLTTDLMDDFDAEKQLIASIYFDTFNEIDNSSYSVVVDPFLDSTPAPSARAPVSAAIVVSMVSSTSTDASASVRFKIDGSDRRTIGLTDAEMSHATSLLNSRSSAECQSVFESLSCVQEWLSNLPPFFLLSQSVLLPDEVVLQIFAHLTPHDLVAVAQVCRQWRKIALDPVFWTHHLLRSAGLDAIATHFSLLYHRGNRRTSTPIEFYFGGLRAASTVRSGQLDVSSIALHGYTRVTAADPGGGHNGKLLVYATANEETCNLAMCSVARKRRQEPHPHIELDYPIDKLAWHRGGELVFGASSENQLVQLWKLDYDPRSRSLAPSFQPLNIFPGFGEALAVGQRQFFASNGGAIACTDFDYQFESGPVRLQLSNGQHLSSSSTEDLQDAPQGHLVHLRLSDDERSLFGLSRAELSSIHRWDLRQRGDRPASELRHGFDQPRSLFLDEASSLVGVTGNASRFLVFDIRVHNRPLFKIESEKPDHLFSELVRFNGSTVALTLHRRPLRFFASLARWEFHRPYKYVQTWMPQINLPEIRAPAPCNLFSASEYLIFTDGAASREMTIIEPSR